MHILNACALCGQLEDLSPAILGLVFSLLAGLLYFARKDSKVGFSVYIETMCSVGS